MPSLSTSGAEKQIPSLGRSFIHKHRRFRSRLVLRLKMKVHGGFGHNSLRILSEQRGLAGFIKKEIAFLLHMTCILFRNILCLQSVEMAPLFSPQVHVYLHM